MASPARACSMATRVAGTIPIWSIPIAGTLPTPTASAQARMAGARRSRTSGDSRFESSTCPKRGEMPDGCGGKITAAATTGPAHAPRPASSKPATRQVPASHNRVSSARSGQGRCLPVLLRDRNDVPRSAGQAPAGAASLLGQTLAQARRLAGPPTQEVKARPPHLGAAQHFDPLDSWGCR